MKYFLLAVFLGVAGTAAYAQQPLPANLFLTMRDSTTSMDVVFMQGKGRSLSLDGRNVRLFNTFFDNKPARKQATEAAGSIMWLINGREFLSGSFFVGDSTGYVITSKNGTEYINLINPQGNSFFKSQLKE